MRFLLILFLIFPIISIFSQTVETPRTIHVYVALCDNEHQGIVQVPSKIGNGKDPANNLYWGCGYGVQGFFKYHSPEWKQVKIYKNVSNIILERIVFKHTTKDIYLCADAYDGEFIKQTTIDFLKAASGDNVLKLKIDSTELNFGGGASLISYIGHDGLMDFELELALSPKNTSKRDVIILACISKSFFKEFIKAAGANPLVWTTGLMAPEAYTLKWAIDGWVLNETDAQIRERAAKAYDNYQHCGINGARNLLVTGF